VPDGTPQKTPTRSSWGCFGVWTLGILLLYVLSLGPVLLIINKSGADPLPVLTTVYAPLIALYEHVPAVQSFYDWYFHAWGL